VEEVEEKIILFYSNAVCERRIQSKVSSSYHDILAPHFHKSKQVTIPGVTQGVGRATKPGIFNSKVMEFLAASK
jgi:hypothetical protein